MPRARGDEADLFREHHAKLVRMVRRLGVGSDVAEEAAQFAFLKLFEKQPERSSVFGWLFTVAKHEAFRLVRVSRREEAVERLPERPGEGDLADVVDKARVEELLRGAMAGSLSANQRVALGLWARGLTYKEIAAETGRTYTWVNRHVREGMARLRELLGGEGG